LDERSEGEDDGGGVAAGVGDDAGTANLVAMEFRAAVDGFGLKLGGVFGVGVFEFIYGAVRGLVETPCAAEVDDPDAALDGFGDPLAGLLVRCGEEEDLGTGVGEFLPAEGMNFVLLAAPWSREMRVQVFEVRGDGGFGFACTAQKDWGCFAQAGMVQEKACEFAARVAAHARDRDSGCSGLRLHFFEYGCCCWISQDSLRCVSLGGLPASRRGR